MVTDTNYKQTNQA